MGYSKKPGAENDYNGKYMTMWKRDSLGKLKIISEAFGSDKYINREDMPYASVVVEETKKQEEVNVLSEKLRPGIEEFDKGPYPIPFTASTNLSSSSKLVNTFGVTRHPTTPASGISIATV
jgi:hypothetical protein